jgi:hypothetical protein
LAVCVGVVVWVCVGEVVDDDGDVDGDVGVLAGEVEMAGVV